MNPRLHARVGLQALIAVSAFVLPFVAAARVGDLPPPIGVEIGKRLVYLQPGATFGRLVARFHLQPESGDLLDVEGRVLEKDVFPGRVLLDGRVAPDGTALAEGDRIKVVDRTDRVEALLRTTIHLPGRQPGNPQFYLGTAPGVQIVTTGKVSGKLVNSVFQPTGPSHTPPAVALTFDDGPNTVYTPRILRILKRFHVHATFFTVGYLVEEFPHVVRKEKRAGMAVGNHTWNHPISPAFRSLTTERIQDEMRKAKDALAKVGVRPRVFRPPGGSYSGEVVELARRMRMRVVLWSIDPHDWEAGVTSTDIIVNVLSNVHPGSIILLHDGGGDQSATVQALPTLIKRIRKMGLRFLPVR